MSKISKLTTTLSAGKTVTPAQITARFGLANPTAAIHTLRKQGYAIETSYSQAKSGTVTTRYAMV